MSLTQWLQTDTGRMSRTLVVQWLGFVLGKVLPLVLAWADTLPWGWAALVMFVVGGIQTIWTDHLRRQNGEPVKDGTAGEPMPKAPPPATGLVGIVVAILLVGCAPSPWVKYPVVDGKHRVPCAEASFQFLPHPTLPRPAGIVVPMCGSDPLPMEVVAVKVVPPTCEPAPESTPVTPEAPHGP